MNLDDYIKRPKIPRKTPHSAGNPTIRAAMSQGFKYGKLHRHAPPKKDLCIRGHDLSLPGARFQNSRHQCVECNKLACRVAYAANREKRQIYARMQYQKRKAERLTEYLKDT